MSFETDLATHLRSEASAPIPPGPGPSQLRATARRRRTRNRVVTGTMVTMVAAISAGGLLLPGTGDNQRVEVVDEPPAISEEESTRAPDPLPSSVEAEAADIQIQIDGETAALPIAVTAVDEGFSLISLGQAGGPALAYRSDDGQAWTAVGEIEGPVGQATSLQLGYRDGTYTAVAEGSDQIFVGSSDDLVSWTMEAVDGAAPGRDLILDLEMTENGLAFTTELRRASTEELVAVLRPTGRLSDQELDLICSYTTDSSLSETIQFNSCLEELDQDPPESQPSRTVLAVDNSDPLHAELMNIIGSIGPPEISIWSGPVDGPFTRRPSGVSELDLAATRDHLMIYAAESQLLTVSEDGIEWRPVPIPDGVSGSLSLMTYDDRLILASPTDAVVTTDLGQSWETVMLGLGGGSEEWLNRPQPTSGRAGLVIQGASFPQGLFEENSEPVSVEVDGYTVTINSDGRLIVTQGDEEILDADTNGAAPENLSVAGDGAWVINDPSTGEDLVRIPTETARKLVSATDSAPRSLVVSLDGRSWHNLAIDGIEHNDVMPLVVGANEVLVLGIDPTVDDSPAAQMFRVPLQG